MTYISTILMLFSAVTAIVAAFFWWKSAKVETPDSFPFYVVQHREMPLGVGRDGSMLDGGKFIGNAYSDNINKLADALKKQSKMSSIGAIFAAISALLAGLSTILQLLS